MTDSISAFDDFVELAQKAAQKTETTTRETYKTATDRILADKPDTSLADLIRGVLRELGFESSGADAMTDEELIRVVLAGRSVIRLHREHLKNQEVADV